MAARKVGESDSVGRGSGEERGAIPGLRIPPPAAALQDRVQAERAGVAQDSIACLFLHQGSDLSRHPHQKSRRNRPLEEAVTHITVLPSSITRYPRRRVSPSNTHHVNRSSYFIQSLTIMYQAAEIFFHSLAMWNASPRDTSVRLFETIHMHNT